jgi:flagellar biosynthesis protein FlhG
MVDQAAELRRLVVRTVRETTTDAGPSPRLLVLSGGKGGVGVTTLAVNLAVALSGQDARVVLVDADLYRADIATLCGIDERGNVADVLAARRDIQEVLHRGPCGIQVIPGLWAPGHPADYSEAAQQRLLRHLGTLRRCADLIVLDAGNGGNEVVRRFWKAADEVLLVTTPDSVSVMDSYATIKRLAGAEENPTIRLVVNKAADRRVADDVHRRINVSCQRFLGFQIDRLGSLPLDENVELAAGATTPFTVNAPESIAAQAVDQMAAQLVSEIQQRTLSFSRAAENVKEADKVPNSTESDMPLSPIGDVGLCCSKNLS